MVPPSGTIAGELLLPSHRPPLPVLISCFLTTFNVTGVAGTPPRINASRAYTSPLAASDAALPARALCAQQSRGNEVEVIQFTCMLLQFIRFNFRKHKEPRLGGMAGEMNSPHCRRAMLNTATVTTTPGTRLPSSGEQCTYRRSIAQEPVCGGKSSTHGPFVPSCSATVPPHSVQHPRQGPTRCSIQKRTSEPSVHRGTTTRAHHTGPDAIARSRRRSDPLDRAVLSHSHDPGHPGRHHPSPAREERIRSCCVGRP